jgi:hypothetical protein
MISVSDPNGNGIQCQHALDAVLRKTKNHIRRLVSCSDFAELKESSARLGRGGK